MSMLLIAVAITFATSNKAEIALYLWPLDGMVTAPAWLIVMSSFIIGGLLSMCLMWAQALAIRTRLWNLQVKFNRLEAEINKQRSIISKQSDKKVDGTLTTNHAPEPNIKNKETKTFLSQPLPTDRKFH